MIKMKKKATFKKWGVNKTVKINNKKVFIKAIPIAGKILKHVHDTSNIYDLPEYYNYGYGSAGVNPWRELLMHIQTTNYVLNGTCDFFPMMYHYRVIKDDNNDQISSGLEQKLMDRWDNNKNIIKYLEDRINAKHKIVLFLEYIPHVAYKYLNKNPSFVSDFYKQSKSIIKFCNKNGILHNDAHLGNFIIDNDEKVYLTDFGLSLSKKFDLDKQEIKFMKMNKNLDRVYLMDNVASTYINRCIYNKKIYKKYNLDVQKTSTDLYTYLIDNIDEIKNDLVMSNFEIKYIKHNRDYIISYIAWKGNFKAIKNKNNYYVTGILTHI
jgi:serine/threonine protein kinase